MNWKIDRMIREGFVRGEKILGYTWDKIVNQSINSCLP